MNQLATDIEKKKAIDELNQEEESECENGEKNVIFY
jgi:hypothetical protein